MKAFLAMDDEHTFASADAWPFSFCSRSCAAFTWSTPFRFASACSRACLRVSRPRTRACTFSAPSFRCRRNWRSRCLSLASRRLSRTILAAHRFCLFRQQLARIVAYLLSSATSCKCALICLARFMSHASIITLKITLSALSRLRAAAWLIFARSRNVRNCFCTRTAANTNRRWASLRSSRFACLRALLRYSACASFCLSSCLCTTDCTLRDMAILCRASACSLSKRIPVLSPNVLVYPCEYESTLRLPTDPGPE
mmetsp:Transcript_17733/g.46365  ORF Transcript_17733/g.46365 Transcript_17733/m.46365 type:complete len:255 (+) Transcript_17733:357-1121(+)